MGRSYCARLSYSAAGVGVLLGLTTLNQKSQYGTNFVTYWLCNTQFNCDRALRLRTKAKQRLNKNLQGVGLPLGSFWSHQDPLGRPARLKLSPDGMGLVNLASIRRFKHPSTLRNQIDTLTINDVGFDIPELADIITAAQKHASDIIISKGKHSPVLAIKAASVNHADNQLEITMLAHRGGTARISLPAAKMIQTGPDTFRYAGKLTSHLPDIYWTTEGQRVSAVYGVVTLSKDPETQQYELKMLLAEEQTIAIAPERGFLTGEQLLITGISLPLAKE